MTRRLAPYVIGFGLWLQESPKRAPWPSRLRFFGAYAIHRLNTLHEIEQHATAKAERAKKPNRRSRA